MVICSRFVTYLINLGPIHYKVPDVQMKIDVTNTKKPSGNAVEIAKRHATPPRVLEKTDLSEVKSSNDSEEQGTENNEGISRCVNTTHLLFITFYSCACCSSFKSYCVLAAHFWP